MRLLPRAGDPRTARARRHDQRGGRCPCTGGVVGKERGTCRGHERSGLPSHRRRFAGATTAVRTGQTPGSAVPLPVSRLFRRHPTGAIAHLLTWVADIRRRQLCFLRPTEASSDRRSATIAPHRRGRQERACWGSPRPVAVGSSRRDRGTSASCTAAIVGYLIGPRWIIGGVMRAIK